MLSAYQVFLILRIVAAIGSSKEKWLLRISLLLESNAVVFCSISWIRPQIRYWKDCLIRYMLHYRRRLWTHPWPFYPLDCVKIQGLLALMPHGPCMMPKISRIIADLVAVWQHSRPLFHAIERDTLSDGLWLASNPLIPLRVGKKCSDSLEP